MSKTIKVHLSAAVFVFAVFGLAHAGPASGPVWNQLTPVPLAAQFSTGIEGMSVASVGDKIIAAFGYESGFGGDTMTTRIYDIASDTWSMGAPGPAPSSEGAGIAHGGLFYNIGGRNVGGFNANWAYHPPSNTWAVNAPMPTGRAGLAVAVVGNAIYAIGGRTATGGPCAGGGLAELDTVERYDIDTDTWSTAASLLSPRSDAAAAVVGGKIYLFGGCRGPAMILSDVDVYNPVTDMWSTAPTDLPTARAALYAVASKGGTVYVIGGWDGIGSGLDTNEAYKVAQDTWTTGLLPMPTPRAETGAADHHGSIYIVGGGQPGFGASVDANEVFKP